MAVNPEPEEENLLDNAEHTAGVLELRKLLASLVERKASHAKAMMLITMSFVQFLITGMSRGEAVRMMMVAANDLHNELRPDEHGPNCKHPKESQ